MITDSKGAGANRATLPRSGQRWAQLTQAAPVAVAGDAITPTPRTDRQAAPRAAGGWATFASRSYPVRLET